MYAPAQHILANTQEAFCVEDADAPFLLEIAQGTRLVIVDSLRQVHFQDENHSNVISAVVSVFKRVTREAATPSAALPELNTVHAKGGLAPQ
jgi:hypothetical protein